MPKKYTLNRNWLNIPRRGGGGEGGYEPDYRTIGLTSNNTLAVRDYISATMVNSLIEQLDISLKDWTTQNFCPEYFAVELDGRLENLEEDVIPNIEGDITQLESELTALTPKVERALLIPTATITAPELAGYGTDKAQKRVKIGSGLGFDSSTNTLYATGGGGGGADPLFIHCAEFVYDSNWKFWIRWIDNNANTMTKEQFFSNTRRIVSLYGTTNQAPSSQNFQFLGSMGSNGIIFTTGYENGTITALEITEYESEDWVHWGVEPLNPSAVALLKKLKANKKSSKKTKIRWKLRG